jgi:hypothetical protein
MAKAEVSLVQDWVDASRLSYDTSFLSYVASRYAQEVRRTTNVPFFRPSHLGKGTRWRPRCIPPANGTAQASSLPAPVDRCAGRSRVRIMLPDTRQLKERSCSPHAPMTEGDFSSPLDTARPTSSRLDCNGEDALLLWNPFEQSSTFLPYGKDRVSLTDGLYAWRFRRARPAPWNAILTKHTRQLTASVKLVCA